ncbi:26S proteasome non-ATPase regulatory subunit 3 [Lingula anatina]|uniref:26S proteasome regulatory subunit RPN3 n=1 Tax=Lingula anatina TaxID=7574 RepID=A0A1S3HZA8_LINAN|nr:26S proteasome non-ATPase regulatory subunit 3 [Lingula anatina]|eukprot:XP_013391357.1 26S proteasome non-ATPase regulatory subunit 3 [Lingula anatina]
MEKKKSESKSKSTDVEMKDVSKEKKEKNDKEEKEKEEPPKDPDLLTLEDIREHIRHIDKAVSTKEPRYVMRVVRALVTTRRKLNHNVLRKAITGCYPAASEAKADLLSFLDEAMDTDSGTASPFRLRSARSPLVQLLPEVDIYLHLLVTIHLIDTKKYDKAVKCSDLLMKKLLNQNRRTLDLLGAKSYFYYSRAYELTNQLERIRSFLHQRLRTATLRGDHEGQATLQNLLLRNYLHCNLYDQADKLVSKSTFPESASNNEWARYLYYLGRIKALQLEYSEAHKNLLQAIRKAPQHAAVGFKQTVHKFLVTVELLLGDIPDRSTFRHKELKKSLAPYFQLTQAVRTGNLAKFNQVLQEYGAKFQAEGTYTLIIRLRHNVIKTGVRSINVSYSRISLTDIAQKLQMDSPEDAEYIVAKAIRDGVIEATIDHDKGYVQSKENIDIYSTSEPMMAFHQRIAFCLDIHNNSVKAMRFPPKSYNKDLESAEERREREQQELESAKEIADEDFDGFP